MKCMVVDDEPLALQMMASYVQKTPGLELCGAFGSSIEALDELRRNKVDLVFLDIQMPDLNGLEMGELLAGTSTRIVFVTAYEQYALQGFKVDALDYLLKPVGYNDFLRAVERARRWFEGVVSDGPAGASSGASSGASAEASETLFVRSDYRWVKIRLCDILFVESVKDYVKIYLDPEGKSRQGTPGAEFCVMTLQSIKTLEDALPQDSFVRVHRSFIINMHQMQTVEKGRVNFAGGLSALISDTYRPLLEQRIARKTI